jgi:hypothetical protein
LPAARDSHRADHYTNNSELGQAIKTAPLLPTDRHDIHRATPAMTAL